MKPILEWLEWAKEQGYEWAESAIRNYIRHWTDASPKNKVDSLVRALEVAFLWSDSPEKEEFWHGVSENLRVTVSGDSPLIEYLIEDLGKLNNALGNLAYNDTLKEPYRTQVFEATKASYEEQLAEVKSEIAKALGLKERKLIGWAVQNEDGGYSMRKAPNFIKGYDGWLDCGGISWSDITPEEAASLCDRLPQWSDDKPIPIYE